MNGLIRGVIRKKKTWTVLTPFAPNVDHVLTFQEGNMVQLDYAQPISVSPMAKVSKLKITAHTDRASSLWAPGNVTRRQVLGSRGCLTYPLTHETCIV